MHDLLASVPTAQKGTAWVEGWNCLYADDVRVSDLVRADFDQTTERTGGDLYLVEEWRDGEPVWRGCRLPKAFPLTTKEPVGGSRSSLIPRSDLAPSPSWGFRICSGWQNALIPPCVCDNYKASSPPSAGFFLGSFAHLQ